MKKTEINLLHFLKNILSSYKLIIICVLVMLGVGTATYESKGQTILEVRLFDQNGAFDNESVDYIRHLLIVNTKLINQKKDFSSFEDIIVDPTSDSISVFITIKSRQADEITLKKFSQDVIDISQKDYIQFYLKKNAWVRSFDDNVGNDRVEKYNFESLEEYRNFIFWKNYAGEDIFLVEFVNGYYVTESIIKRLLISIGFGLFLGIALSILRFAIKE